MFDFSVRTCAAHDGEVWIAKQQGGLTVVDIESKATLKEIPVVVDGTANSILNDIVPVNNEMWCTTSDGKLIVFNTPQYKLSQVVRLPGAEKSIALSRPHFDGYRVLIPSETGRIFVLDERTKKQVGVLAAEGPCTAVTTIDGYFVGGDKDGRLYVWDAASLRCFAQHNKSKSEVLHILFEPATNTIWVARGNGNIDIYVFAANQFTLAARVSPVGRVTGLESVSGKIVATTAEKKMYVISALTGKIEETIQSEHKSFIQGMAKIQKKEIARLWTFSNEGSVKTWELEGNFVSANETKPKIRDDFFSTSNDTHLRQLSENARLGVKVEEERLKGLDFCENLRSVREEAQELRLKLNKLQEELEVKKEELLKSEQRVKDLNEENNKCKRDVTDITEKITTVEKERSSLQSEINTLKDDLSKVRMEVSEQITKNSQLSQECSLAKTEKTQMEQRLHDAEGKIATIEGENSRLCRSIGSVTNAQNAEKDVQNQILKESQMTRDEIERMRKLNKVLSSALASMEYTIRKKEEEEKDLTALLNAYRRKVADRVSDPHLAALLIATMVRNPARFDLQCDDITKGELLDRNGPFIQFIHSLRDTDFDAYNKLMDYLQKSSEGVLSSEAQELLDKFLSLATTEGAVSGEVMSSFKRSIPTSMPSDRISNQLQPALDAARSEGGNGGGYSGVAGYGGGGAGTTASSDIPAYLRGPDHTVQTRDEELVTNALLREIKAQKNLDENYVKEHQVLFEFILKTRRALVERLALLQKRTVSAKQVIEALTIASNSPHTTSGGASSPLKRSQSLQSVFVGIIQELVELTTDIVSKYFTNAERQRLNIQ